MKNLLTAILFISFLLSGNKAYTQIYSFEDGTVPSSFSSKVGTLSISTEKFKLGSKSLCWQWQANDKLELQNPNNLANASIERMGGLTFWIYNTQKSDAQITLHFSNPANEVNLNYKVKLNFEGWRNIAACFTEDMGHNNMTIRNMTIHAPVMGSGAIYFDYLQFVKSSAWERMSSDQHTVRMTRTDIDDFVKIRDAIPTTFTKGPTQTQKEDISKITQRLDDWYLSDGGYGDNQYFRWRNNNTNTYVRRGNTYFAGNLKNQIKKQTDGTVSV